MRSIWYFLDSFFGGSLLFYPSVCCDSKVAGFDSQAFIEGKGLKSALIEGHRYLFV